ncbi:MAG: tRNA (adenosine(37)-N6)-threonylcarbamoyltransferase complex dimerization subunit type 1 TsaB [Candidatus Goldiibacteriota bacterium]
MYSLLTDTSTNEIAAAVFRDDEKLFEGYFPAEKRYNAVFMDCIDSGFKKAGIKPGDVDVFASTLGPGAFTGVRISIAAMKAFALSLDKLFFGVSTLEILAASAEVKNGHVTAVIDARRGEVYTAGFEVRDAEIRPDNRGMLLRKKEDFFADNLSGCAVLIKRDEFLVEYFKKSSKIDIKVKEHIEMESFYRLLAQNRDNIKKEDLYGAKPVYIRKPDAEKGSKKGMK